MATYYVDVQSLVCNGYELEAENEQEAIHKAWEKFYEDLKTGDVIFEEDEHSVELLED